MRRSAAMASVVCGAGIDGVVFAAEGILLEREGPLAELC